MKHQSFTDITLLICKGINQKCKFQTGFDQPLLSAMFLDKAIKGVNGVQTVSRLNRKHVDKEQDDILVVDFTNSTKNIVKAFNQHRKGSPNTEKELDKSTLDAVCQSAIDEDVFSLADYVKAYGEAEEAAKNRESELDALLSNINQEYKARFLDFYSEAEDWKAYIAILNRYIKLYYFIAKFFELEASLDEFIVFAEVMAGCLIKKGKTSALKLLLKNIEVSKGGVTYVGQVTNTADTPKVSTPRVAIN